MREAGYIVSSAYCVPALYRHFGAYPGRNERLTHCFGAY